MIPAAARRPGRSAAGVLLAALSLLPAALLLLPAEARGQAGEPDAEVPGLDRVAAALDSGRAGEARSALDRWFAARQAAAPDSTLLRARFLRARAASDPDSAERDYLWVAVEGDARYGALAWLRLAQLHHSRGQLDRALKELERLRRDYPGGEVLPRAWLWTARVRRASGEATGACLALEQAREAAAGTGRAGREVRERIRRELGECAAEGAPAASEEASGEEVPARGYAVQLGAFRDRGGAESLKEEARSAGFEVRITGPGPDRGLYRVRTRIVGSRAAAERLAKRVDARGLPAYVVSASSR